MLYDKAGTTRNRHKTETRLAGADGEGDEPLKVPRSEEEAVLERCQWNMSTSLGLSDWPAILCSWSQARRGETFPSPGLPRPKDGTGLTLWKCVHRNIRQYKGENTSEAAEASLSC